MAKTKDRKVPQNLLTPVLWSDRTKTASGIKAVHRMFMRNRDKKIGPEKRPYTKSEIWHACIRFHFTDALAQQRFENERKKLREARKATKQLEAQKPIQLLLFETENG